MLRNGHATRAEFFTTLQFGSWRNEETDESSVIVDSSVPLMHHDPLIALGQRIGRKASHAYQKNITDHYCRLYFLEGFNSTRMHHLIF